MKLYKYTNVKNGLDIIKNCSLVITKPENFNDPYDFKPYWDEEDLEKACDFAANCAFELYIIREINEISERNGNIVNKTFFKILKKDYQLIKEIVRINPSKYKPIITTDKFLKLKLKYASKRENLLNKIAYKKNLDEIVNRKKNDLKEIFKNLQKVRDKIYIGCLSECYDETTMWAHYSDSHKGICIEFDIPKDEENQFWKINYSDRSNYQLYNLTREFCGRIVAFDELPDDIKLIQMQKRILNPWLIKENKWETEKERRIMFSEEDIVKYPENFSKIKKDNKELILYKMPAISKVILGYKCFSNDKDNVVNLCKMKNIKLEKTYLDEKTFKLNFEVNK